MEIVYSSRLTLAQFFEQSGDNWLADHFYSSCLKTSLKIRGDGRRKECEANANMGVTLEKRGKWNQSLHGTKVIEIQNILSI